MASRATGRTSPTEAGGASSPPSLSEHPEADTSGTAPNLVGGKMAKLPFMQFYPADWLQDTQILSLEAQGAWIKILCVLHAASERGRKTLPTLEWKQFLGYPEDDRALYLLNRLSEVGDIDARDSDGNTTSIMDSMEITISSRRMIRDESKRNQELERKRQYEERNPTRHRQSSDTNPTPIYQKSEVRSHTSIKSKRATQYPENFQVSPEVQAWALKERLPDPETQLPAFRDYHQAKGSTFKDWEAALRTWLRNAPKFAGNGQSRTSDLAHSTVPPYKPKPKEAKASPEEQARVKVLLHDLTEKF